jgi:hypothetical protein
LIRRLPTIAVGTRDIGTDWIETEPTETRLVALAPGTLRWSGRETARGV